MARRHEGGGAAGGGRRTPKLALPITNPAGDSATVVALPAWREGNGHVIQGGKVAVIDAPLADAAGQRAHLRGRRRRHQPVPGRCEGARRVDEDLPHARQPAARRFRQGRAVRRLVVGAEGQGLEMLEEARLPARLEAVGAMKYLRHHAGVRKTRKQFGQNIGAFQALQHRMVDM